MILRPGESILFTTDGVSETLNSEEKFFGEQRICDAILGAKGPPWGPGLLETLNRWRGATEPNDDVTLLEIWRDKAKERTDSA